jgi:hypothetical protein
MRVYSNMILLELGVMGILVLLNSRYCWLLVGNEEMNYALVAHTLLVLFRCGCVRPKARRLE